MSMKERSEYIAFEDVLRIYGLTRDELLELINSFVYARRVRLPSGVDVQTGWDIHRESLYAALHLAEIRLEYGPLSDVAQMAELRAAAARTRLMEADGRPVTPMQADVADAVDAANNNREGNSAER